nr:unnamed protein product [Callosobruchus analis]
MYFFTVHAFKNGHYMPVVFILLPDKRAETYVAAFKALAEKCNDYELTLSPQEVVIDFEYGIHKSVCTIWPSAKIIGCRFHLSQPWYRKILQLGLSEEYKNSESIVGKYLKIHFGVPFLEPNEAYDFFFNELYFLLPNDVRVIEFRNYLKNNYFKLDAHFPPAIWASSTNFINRTTNGCESFHSKFNECFYSPHPNVFNFANILLEFQTLIYVKIKTANLFVKKKQKQQKKKENI